MARIHTISDEASLENVLADHGTVVIDFWAPWCPPCREFMPVLEQAADRHSEMAFCRASMEHSKELAQAFDVESVPALIVIRDRIMIVSQPGYLPAEKLDRLLAQVSALDMEQVRREMRAAQDGGAEPE